MLSGKTGTDLAALFICLAGLISAVPPLTIEGHALTVTPSVGICFYPEDGQNRATLMQRADLAMYTAKENGGGQLQNKQIARLLRSDGTQGIKGP